MEPIDATTNDYLATVIAQKLEKYIEKSEGNYNLLMTEQVWVIPIKHCKFNSMRGFYIDYCTLRDNGQYYTASAESPVNRNKWELPRIIKVVNPSTYTMVTFKIAHDIQSGEHTLGWSEAKYIGEHNGDSFAITVSFKP